MKSPRRKKVRLQSLDRNYNTRVRWEALDADYLNKLSPAELEYYAQFIDEYVGGAIAKNKDGTPKKGHIHNTKELAKSCYDANNRRNNDIISISKATNRLDSLNRTPDEKENPDQVSTYEKSLTKNPNLTEEAIIAQIDSGEQNEMLTFKEYIQVRKNMTLERRAELDPIYLKENPRAYMYYYLFDNTRITNGKLDRLLANPELLEKFVENFEFFKRKKNRPYRR